MKRSLLRGVCALNLEANAALRHPVPIPTSRKSTPNLITKTTSFNEDSVEDLDR